ncbi:hypothetical protein GCM10025858_33490 [Alicyclobacillus sacchari]|nr:hypothetical protein GCM10025858_33490 [Alicyclobacillus sacchari]
MEMVRALDAGPMIAQRELPIDPDVTAGELHDSLALLGGQMCEEVLPAYVRGELQAVPQPEAGVTYAEKLTRRDEWIDWRRSADAIALQVRAMAPWPGASAIGPDGKQLKILRGYVGTGDLPGESGLARRNGDTAVVACGTGVYVVEQVQPAGKRPMSAGAWLAACVPIQWLLKGSTHVISPARWTAYHTLVRVAKDQAYVNLALQHALAKRELSDRDKALATEIAYGTVRRQLTIDQLLAPYVRRGLRSMESETLTILRMSVYQLSWLSKLPAYAVTSDAVELAKRVNPRSASFVNAVLRSYLRDGTDWEKRLDSLREDFDDIAQLSLLHSYPRWMVTRLVATYGRERADAILAAGNRPGVTSVRVNALRASVESVTSALAAQGIVDIERGSLYDGALRIMGAIDVERLDLYRDGLLTVQDEGAMLIAPLLRPEPGMRILDMCAAPGGKTTQIAELMRDTGVIDAYDVYMAKVQTIADACSRLHIASVRARLGDGRDVLGDPPYDAVLVDAPCSGLGVMRRRPDIRQRRTEADVAALTALQADLLRHACRIVKPGGYVVYATCTLLPEENEQVVLRVIDELEGAVSLDDIAGDLPASLADRVTVGLTLTPEMFATDGFYMARLRRN